MINYLIFGYTNLSCTFYHLSQILYTTPTHYFPYFPLFYEPYSSSWWTVETDICLHYSLCTRSNFKGKYIKFSKLTKLRSIIQFSIIFFIIVCTFQDDTILSLFPHLNPISSQNFKLHSVAQATHCLKITQNVAFEFLYFGIFHHFLSY